MATEKLNRYVVNSLTGGIAEGTSTRGGYKNAFNDGLGIDFRTDPDKIHVLPPLKKEYSTYGYVRHIIREMSDTWFYDSLGQLYRRNSAGTYANYSRPTSSGPGFGYFNSSIYVARDSNLDKMTTPAGSPSFTSDYFISSAGAATFVNRGDRDINNISGATPTNWYTTLSNFSAEAAVDKKQLVPNKTSFRGVVLFVHTKTAGASLILTLHDSTNTAVWTQTYLAADITTDVYNRFTPTNTVKLTRGGIYHLHVTYTGPGQFTIGVGTTGDLSTASIATFFNPIENSTYHQMKVFTNKLCYCNGHFLGTIDDAEVLNSESVTFPPDEVAHCLECIGDYIACATWNGTTTGASGKSRIYFWDGTAATFNSFIDVNGQVNAMVTNNNLLYVIHGTQNILSVYDGALTLIRRLKFVEQNDTCLVAEGGMTNWEGLVLWGINSGTSTLDRAVYSYGVKSKDYPDALNKDFQTSLRTMADTVSIWATYGLDAQNLFVSWQDTSFTAVSGVVDAASTASTLVATTGIFTAAMVNRYVHNTTDNTFRKITGFTNTTTVTVDVAINNTWDGDSITVLQTNCIDNIDTTKKETDAYFTTLRYDASATNIEKNSKAVSLRTLSLETDQSIDIYYRLNSNGDYLFLDTMSGEENPGVFYKAFDFQKQFFEVEFKLKINGNGTTAPVILCFELYFDDIPTNYQAGSRKS